MTDFQFAWIVYVYWIDRVQSDPEPFAIVFANRWMTFIDICDELHDGPDCDRIEAIEVERMTVSVQ